MRPTRSTTALAGGQRGRHDPQPLIYANPAAGQVQHAEPDEEPGARVAADQPVLLESADQPVDDRAVDLEAVRELGDRQALRRLRQHAQHLQAAIEGL